MTESTPKDVYEAHPEIAKHAHIKSLEQYERLYRLSLDDPETFWAKHAEELLTWFSPWHHVFDNDYDNVDFAWFLGGRINARDHLGRRRPGEYEQHHLSRAA
jgi:acetyl-CoA synthetase